MREEYKSLDRVLYEEKRKILKETNNYRDATIAVAIGVCILFGLFSFLIIKSFINNL